MNAKKIGSIFLLKLQMKYFFLLFASLFLGSCAFHSGTMNSSVTSEPVVHKDLAVGVASTKLVFGFGGLSKDALILEARKNMVASRPLDSAEQYNNISIDVKRTIFLMVFKTKVTMVADVVEPKDSISQPSYTNEYLAKIRQPHLAMDLFAVGDTVYVGKFDFGKIIRFIEDDSYGKVEVQYKNAKGDFRTKIVSVKRIFSLKEEHRGYKIGQEISSGRILAFGLMRILVDHPADSNMTTPYP